MTAERQRFENLVKARYGWYSEIFSRDTDGHYESDEVAALWEFYQEGCLMAMHRCLVLLGES